MSSYLFGKNCKWRKLGKHHWHGVWAPLTNMAAELFPEVQHSSEELKPWPFFMWPWPWEVRYVWVIVVWKDCTDSSTKGPMSYTFFFIFFIHQVFIQILIADSPPLSPPSPPSPLSCPKPSPFLLRKEGYLPWISPSFCICSCSYIRHNFFFWGYTRRCPN